MRNKKRLGPAKAKMMLKDNSAQGHKLTGKQKNLFQAIAHGMKQNKRNRAAKRGGGAVQAAKGIGQAAQKLGTNEGMGERMSGGGIAKPLTSVSLGQQKLMGTPMQSIVKSLNNKPSNYKPLRKLQRGMKGYRR